MAYSVPPTTSPSTALSGESRRRKAPPISISTNRWDVDPLRLRELLLSSGHSCHRFPALSSDGLPLPVDLPKLRLALFRSSFVVSAFSTSASLFPQDRPAFSFEDLLHRAVPVPSKDRTLIGFGRVVSDGGLTASIHDVVVIPSLRRLGIGRKIVQRLISLFFKACGFGDDCLGSTTMIYTRSAPSNEEEGLSIHRGGQRLLLVPPLPTPGAYPSKSNSTETVDLLEARNLI